MVLGMRMMRTSGRMYAEGLTGNKGGGARSRAGEGRFGGIVGGLRRFAADERGATAIEYGLIVAGLAALLVASLSLVGASLSSKFSSAASGLAK